MGGDTNKVWARVLCAFLAAATAGAAATEEARRASNWVTPNTPSFEEPQFSAQDEVILPALTNEAASPTRSLSDGTSFRVSSITVQGSSALGENTVQPIVSPYLNRDITFSDLEYVRLALTRAYVEAGYVNSGVVIPDQSIEPGGSLTMRAIEGQLSVVQVGGQPSIRHRYITGRIARHVGTPMKLDDIQFALQRLQKDDLVRRVDAELLPGTERGLASLRVSVEETPRAEFGVSTDNHHSASLGEHRGRASLLLRNLSGWGDTVHATVATSEGSDSWSLDVAAPLSRYDTTLELYASRSEAELVEDAFSVLDIFSTTDVWGLALSQPLRQTLNLELTASLGLEVKHSESELLGVPFSFSPGAQNGESDTTSVVVGLDATHRGPAHVFAVRGTYRRGINWLDATKHRATDFLAQLQNPTGADGEFELVLVQALWLRRLNAWAPFAELDDRWQLLARTTAQISNSPLMSLEKISIGGANTVRGYNENTLVRDNGLAATVELQMPIPGYEAESLRDLVVSAFVDYGRAWDRKAAGTAGFGPSTASKRYIVSGGLGLQWRPHPSLDFRLYWGEPIDDNFSGDDPRDFNRGYSLQGDGLHFSLAYSKAI